MKTKKYILKQIGLLIIYAFIFILMMIVHNLVNEWVEQGMRDFMNPISMLLVSPIIMIFFGMLLNFEGFVKERLKNGRWKFSRIRFLIVVLPLTILSFYYAIYYSQILGSVPMAIYITGTVMSISQVMHGFLFVSCFTKVNNNRFEG